MSKEMIMGKGVKDRTGKRYGRLIVKKFAGVASGGYGGVALWKCKCDCGREIIVSGGHLHTGHTRSCGCFCREVMSIGRKGKNNPAYISGKNCDTHTRIILDLREKVRKRDNYTCQECGRTQEQELKETGRILSVHHIDGDDTNNVKENMITYCESCHSKIPKNKKLEKELMPITE